jgi:hypothetical protein
MQKHGSHLLAFLSLAAYFLATTHVSLAGDFCDHGMRVANHFGLAHDDDDCCLSPKDSPADCPHDSDGPCSSCPDDCSLCNLAKLPCTPTESVLVRVVNLVGDYTFEEAFDYLPPQPIELIRPPRT